MPNAGPELLPEAGVRNERTLLAVSSRPWLGAASAWDTNFEPALCPLPAYIALVTSPFAAGEE
jgi:hypothetical protein